MSLDSCCDILNSLGMRADGVNSVQLAVDHAVKRHQEGKDYFPAFWTGKCLAWMA